MCGGCAIYHIFNICQGNRNNFEHKSTPKILGEGIIIYFFIIQYYLSYYPLPLPTLVGWIFVLKIISVALVDTKYVIYSTPTTHALQILATYMLQYHKSILPRAKFNIFTHTKVGLPSEFKCDFNAPKFSLIRC